MQKLKIRHVFEAEIKIDTHLNSLRLSEIKKVVFQGFNITVIYFLQNNIEILNSVRYTVWCSKKLSQR